MKKYVIGLIIIVALILVYQVVKADEIYPGFIISTNQKGGDLIIKVTKVEDSTNPYPIDIYVGKDRSTAKIVAQEVVVTEETSITINEAKSGITGNSIVIVCPAGQDCRSTPSSNIVAFDASAKGPGLMANIFSVFGRIFSIFK